MELIPFRGWSGFDYCNEDYKPKKRICGVETLTPPVHNTLDGSFSQLIQFKNEPELQANISVLEPRSIKGHHIHFRGQIDYFYPLDPLIIGLIDDRPESETKGVKMKLMAHRQIVKIPPGILHSIFNPGYERRSLLYFVTYLYREGENELRVEWDAFGKDFWETKPS